MSRQGSKRLTKGDLPRRVRSPRTLSACNEQIFKFEQDIQSQTLDVQQINKALIKRDSQKSIQLEPPPTTSASASAKAVSCEALPSENKNPSSSKPSKTQKSAQVIFLRGALLFEQKINSIFSLQKVSYNGITILVAYYPMIEIYCFLHLWTFLKAKSAILFLNKNPLKFVRWILPLFLHERQQVEVILRFPFSKQ